MLRQLKKGEKATCIVCEKEFMVEEDFRVIAEGISGVTLYQLPICKRCRTAKMVGPYLFYDEEKKHGVKNGRRIYHYTGSCHTYFII